MLRLLLLAALSATALGHGHGHGHVWPVARHFGHLDLRPYWRPDYFPLIRLRYPGISDLTASYLIYYIVHNPPRLLLPHLGLKGIRLGTSVPVSYWRNYIRRVVDVLPPVFYGGGYLGTLRGYVGRYYPSILNGYVFPDHLAICDAYFSSHLVAPVPWANFRGFYDRYVLRRGHYKHFPALWDIASSLRGYHYRPARYFRRVSVTSLVHGNVHTGLPTLPVFPRRSLIFQRISQLGYYNYIRRIYPSGWRTYVSRLRHYKFPSVLPVLGHGFWGRFRHLSFLTSPVLRRDLYYLLRLRFYTYPARIIHAKGLRFHNYISRFLSSWRPVYRRYDVRFVRSLLSSFDRYSCGWLVRHVPKYGACRGSRLWGKWFYRG